MCLFGNDRTSYAPVREYMDVFSGAMHGCISRHNFTIKHIQIKPSTDMAEGLTSNEIL